MKQNLSPDQEAEKKLAAEHAVKFVKDGMLIGLGTGSTAAFAILELGRRVAQGLRITGVPSSKATEQLARHVGIPLADFSGISRLDVTVDGADEIDHQLHAVKGGGGALFREKVLAAASDLMIAVVDSGKVVKQLGRAKVPVEVLPFAIGFVERMLRETGADPVIRNATDGARYATDQGNQILDLFFTAPYDPAQLNEVMQRVPGIVAHGLFLTEIDLLVVANGVSLEVRERP